MIWKGSVVRLLAAVPLLAAVIALGSPDGAAAARACGASGVETISGGTVKEGIVVPAGSACYLVGVTVLGGVTVKAGGALSTQDADIRGAVTGTAVDAVQVVRGVVGGNVSVTVAPNGRAATVQYAEVRGSVTLTGAPVYASVTFAAVRGSVTLNGNASAFAEGSVIAGNLACSGNGVVGNNGNPSTVGGAASGQCAGLEAP